MIELSSDLEPNSQRAGHSWTADFWKVGICEGHVEVTLVIGLAGLARRTIVPGPLTSLMMIFPPRCIVLLLTMSTMATPRLQRIPKEIQKPSPLMMAMMYLRGSPKQVQSHTGAFFSGASNGFPSSVNSMLSPVFCLFSRTLPNQRGQVSQRTPRKRSSQLTSSSHSFHPPPHLQILHVHFRL